MKRQYSNKTHRAANRLRTRRWQLSIKWRADARGMSFHIRSTSMRKSATLRTMVLGLFDYRLMQHCKFSIGFKSEFLLGHAIQEFTVLAAAGPWYSQCATCMAPSWLVLHWAVVMVWHSLSLEDLVKIPPSGHDCPGSRPMAVYNYGKATTLPWRKRLRIYIVMDTGRMERLKGTFFDALGVRPIGPSWQRYLLLSFRGYQRFDQWLQLSYPPPKSLLHIIVELRRSSISWLSGGNNSSQTQRTVVIYGIMFRNYWLDYHETWQKWSRGVNFEV